MQFFVVLLCQFTKELHGYAAIPIFNIILVCMCAYLYDIDIGISLLYQLSIQHNHPPTQSSKCLGESPAIYGGNLKPVGTTRTNVSQEK